MRLLCDGTYDGLLTALFDAYRLRPDEVLLRPPMQLDMFDPPQPVVTDLAKAVRIQLAIDEKLSVDSALHVRMVFASGDDDAGTMIYRYVMLGWRLGHALDDHMTHPAVEPMLRLSRRVQLERHKMLGFLRFSPLKNGILYAPCEPDYDIVPLMTDHFAERLRGERFIIHDLRHGTLAFYRPGETLITHAETDRLTTPPDEYAALWRAFYDAICIKGRLNPRLRDGWMPRRYHKYMPEMQGEGGAYARPTEWRRGMAAAQP